MHVWASGTEILNRTQGHAQRGQVCSLIPHVERLNRSIWERSARDSVVHVRVFVSVDMDIDIDVLVNIIGLIGSASSIISGWKVRAGKVRKRGVV